MTTHHVTRYADSAGYVASCSCGWHTTRRTRDLREMDARAHELADTLEIRTMEPTQ